jgi:hypothetical protein
VTWRTGQSGNPAGRKPGSINKRSNEELWRRLEARGDLDPADVLSGIASDLNERKELRIAAANGLMQYKYSKRGLASEPAPLVYVPEPVELPHAHAACVADTIANIEHVSALRRAAKLDQDTADRLVAEQRIIRDGLIEEAKLLVAQGGPRDQRIEIIGGLPPLPGTSIDMVREPLGPGVVNGQAVREGTILPPVPVIPHPQSPLAEKPGPPEPPPHLAKPKPAGDDPA